jgi:anti-sigma regulatory factor (Ser/Thr protein kinase)
MAVSKNISDEIRDFILFNVDEHPADIGRITTEKFGLSRVAVVNRLRSLVKEGMLKAEGNTKARKYTLEILAGNQRILELSPSLTEDQVWLEEIKPYLGDIPENVREICAHGVTEMFNNVIDHSESTTAKVIIGRTPTKVLINIRDYGVGIFNKVQKALNLADPKQAILELTKGKITTDKDHHTGEGIFFTSRMFDGYTISSGTLVFRRFSATDDWLMESDSAPINGTNIIMDIATNATHTAKDIFDRYRAEFDTFGFSKTNIPLVILRYEGEQLISRSQAKRLMARVDQFREVFLDFKGITTVGQAFADEVFRIYRRDHPLMHVIPTAMTLDVTRMIQRIVSENTTDELNQYLENYIARELTQNA